MFLFSFFLLTIFAFHRVLFSFYLSLSLPSFFFGKQTSDLNVSKEIRARAAMIENAEKLLNQAEITAAALEDNPNVSEETKRRAREKVDAFKKEVQKNMIYQNQ